MKNLEKLFIDKSNSIEEAIQVVESGGLGISLVVDKDKHLLGTITDGDIRRAILNRISLGASVEVLLENKNKYNANNPTVMSYGTPTEIILQTMKDQKLRHIPILDENGCVVELALFSEMMDDAPSLSLTAVVMAGGLGKRLRPLTYSLPKPMLPLNNRPILERIIEQLRRSGIVDIIISINYKSDVLVNHFGDGKKFGVNISYLKEDRPLGTAGSLSLINEVDKPLLVINGDVLTQLNFRSMYDFHISQGAAMTVGLRPYEFSIPFGVVEINDIEIINLIEKPTQKVNINAGIYLLSPMAHSQIPKNEYFDMTMLINKLIGMKYRTVGFPVPEYWLDIGQHSDYNQAQEDSLNGKI